MKIAPAVKRAFAPPEVKRSTNEPPPRPSVSLGGTEVMFHTRFNGKLLDVSHSPAGLLAAALADGSVAFVDGSDGRVVAVAEVQEDPPNAMAFYSQWLLHCGDDSFVRMIESKTGKVVHAHSVTARAEAGKRPRCHAVDHVAVLDGMFVAAAGCLVHACCVPSGADSGADGGAETLCELEHVVCAASPVHAVCAAPASQAARWAYSIALKGAVRLL